MRQPDEYGGNATDQTAESASRDGGAVMSRRKAIQLLGGAGALVAGHMLGGGKAFAAEAAGMEAAAAEARAGGGMGTVMTVGHVQELLSLPQGLRKPGTLAYVAGYHQPGDGGGKLVRWVPDSGKADNGGTVHGPWPGRPGRWEAVHDGVADFRWFGLFDGSRNADDALDAMVNDPSIHRIEAHTNLNFARRHVFSRSGIELDFGGYTVTTEGIELNTRDNPFGAVVCFRGTPAGMTDTVTLSADIAEGNDILEVRNGALFQVGDWWIAQIGSLPGGRAQRELDYMLLVTEIVDGTHIRVNYKSGWQLAAGRTVTYTKMNPVFRSRVRNMYFIGVPVPPTTSTSQRPFETWDQIGSNPVAYEFAVECDVSGIRATKVFWPVIQRRYCSHYITESCELINPEERDWGGTGYLTQQLNVLYGNVRNCNTSNARHLNDFTCAAYCMVENCHGDGDDYGPFVTHGQFEHDLVYVGNSGLLSFANSGTNWGDSAKRITVRKHIATRIVAHKKLTDLTLEDCYAITKAGLANSGSIWANVDGLQMRGCTAEQMITLSQSSIRSQRKNIIDSCSFGMVNGYEIARPIRTEAVGFTPINGDLLISNSEFHRVEDVNLGSVNRLTLVNTWFKGASPAAGKVRVGSKEIVIIGGGFQDCGFELTGAWDRARTGVSGQSLTADGGAVFTGTNSLKAFVSNALPDNAVTLLYGNCQSLAADPGTSHFQILGGKLVLKAVGARFQGGRYTWLQGSAAAGSRFFLTACLEEGVDRSGLPPEGEAVQHSMGNMILP